jgi:DNA polymerase-3 subunit delta'
MRLITHKTTQKQIDDFIRKPTHAVALVGGRGLGKKTLARYVCEQLLGKTITKNTREVFTVTPNTSGSIGIETVREIVSFLKLKTIGHSNVQRIITIEDADSLTPEAQNALLKTLEEPASDAVIILTVSDKNSLLPTINSRLKHIIVTTPSKNEIIDFFTAQYDRAAIERNWLISNGRTGLLSSLLTNHDHALLPHIEQAKAILKASRYNKLKSIETLVRQNVELLLEALYIVSSAGFYQAVRKQDAVKQQKWHTIRITVFNTQQRLKYNANSKLLLCNLMLEL